MNEQQRYKAETGQAATYRKDGADYHTLAYVRWIEARVAELEAAAAGETGTPKAEGRYWCETSGSPELLRWWLKCWWRNDSEALPRKEQTGYVLRFHRLPGETYTPCGETP